MALPIPHSSLWLRTAAGGASGDRDNSLAAIYFGGFGNNWVDHREVKRYRDVISFPGLEINEAAGQTFGKAMLEWTLPPLRFRRFGTPARLRELAAPGALRHRARHRSRRGTSSAARSGTWALRWTCASPSSRAWT